MNGREKIQSIATVLQFHRAPPLDPPLLDHVEFNLKKHLTLMTSKLDFSIWSCDTGRSIH